MTETLEEKEPITVVDSVPANSTKTYPDPEGFEFTRPATVTGGRVYTHVGQEFDLQYYIQIRNPGNSQWRPLLEPLAKEFIAGNGETIPIQVRQEIPQGGRVRIRIQNEDTNGYAYDANMLLNIDYQKLGELPIIGGWFDGV